MKTKIMGVLSNFLGRKQDKIPSDVKDVSRTLVLSTYLKCVLRVSNTTASRPFNRSFISFASSFQKIV